jgi:hypothetical protein
MRVAKGAGLKLTLTEPEAAISWLERNRFSEQLNAYSMQF